MPYNSSRRTREKRLRAHYRKKIWTVAIIMLVIGLIAGFVACVYSAKNSERVAELLKIDFKKDSGFVTPEPDLLATQAPIEFMEDEADDAEEDLIAAPTLEIIEAPVETAAPEATPEAEIMVDPELVIEPEFEVEPEATELVIMTPEEAFAAAEAEAAAAYEAMNLPTEEELEAATVEPTAEPTPEPTPEPTAEPTPEPTVEPIIVPYGEAQTIQTQIKADGSARRSADADAFETLDLTLEVEAYKDPAYFEANYADSYNLQGNEAAVEFDITLNGYTGSAEIIPQNFLLITFNGENGETSQGFQLMDTEIAGKTDIAIASDETATLYKRYPYNADQGDMVYMVVNAYNEGVESTYWFEILAPEGSDEAAAAEETAEAEGVELTVGSKGAEVTKLQARLIELGQLSGQPDGHFGNYTASAVKEMQRRYGMEQTGVADQAFLNRIYQ